ncbi:calcyclin-binding protein isoform X3 [Polistes fuscatus]|uniref:calcyclin-binding protein isoform X3 n=1 Tax=Polistes fuscatus TaxID=30207 RepID=UPI001CA80D3E|nr:calcyclin-binding protein isoform X3 [Polistes fuscatus]
MATKSEELKQDIEELNTFLQQATRSKVKDILSLEIRRLQTESVHQLPNSSIVCKYTEKSMDLYVYGLDNKNYHLPINNFCEDIDTEKSYFKVKADMIIVYLSKKSLKNWSHVTGVEKRIKETKTPSVPDMGDDPGTSLVNLMKKIYQDGDDEMKKTIAKAWTENQHKSAAGLSGFDY